MAKRAPSPIPLIAFTAPPTHERPVDGSAFDTLATAFSQRFKDIEQMLETNVGKVNAGATFLYDGKPHRLQWLRVSGAWSLWLDGPTLQGTTPLSQCKVELKIAAANALPLLIQNIRQGEAEKVQRLRDAHAQLDRVTALIKPQEGK